MKIHFEPSSLHQSTSGSITGIVSVELASGCYFPCDSWNDFVIVLANWWLISVTDLGVNGRKARMQFMDGPYWMELKRNDETVFISCVDDHLPQSRPFECECGLKEVKTQIEGFAKSVWMQSTERQMTSDDLRSLGKQIKLRGL